MSEMHEMRGAFMQLDFVYGHRTQETYRSGNADIHVHAEVLLDQLMGDMWNVAVT